MRSISARRTLGKKSGEKSLAKVKATSSLLGKVTSKIKCVSPEISIEKGFFPDL